MFEGILTKPFYGNTLGEWALAILMIIGAFLVGKFTLYVLKKHGRALFEKTKTKIDDIVLDNAEEPLVFALTVAGIWFALRTLNLSEGVATSISKGFYILIIFNVAWFVARITDAFIANFLVPKVEASESDLDDQLLPIVRKGLKLGIWIVAALAAINNAGYDVGAILAGLGIGGLAFALAAQDTVSNLFGGFTIFVDKPFTVNDRVKIAGYDGTIVEIGLRSTRLKTLENRIVTIPNSSFTGNPVENVSSEPNRKVVLNLGLTYDTDEAGMQKAIDLLKEIAAANDSLEEDVYVGFTSFGDFSLGILFIYFIKSGADILGAQTQINLEILRQFNAHKLDMAFPTQTVHHINQKAA